jgi:RNA-directed DNA polymerase
MKSKQETETQSRPREDKWNWVEESIWTENMLIALDNGVKGNKWFSLIDKVYRSDTLALAWEQVKAKKGAGGIDNMTIGIFQANAGKYLQELEQQLKLEEYQPTVKDRVIQMAIKMVIEPIFEREFLPSSYGFRPGKGQKDALRAVDQLIKDGYCWVVDADFKSYFDTIPHDNLMLDIQQRVSDGRILKLIESFLNQEIINELDTNFWNPARGCAQSSIG